MRRNVLAAILAASALVALVGVVALGARTTPGAGERSGGLPASLDTALVLRTILVILVLAVIVLGLSGWTRRRRPTGRVRGSRGSIIGPVILLTALLVAFLNLGPTLNREPPDQVTTTATAAPARARADEPAGSRWGLLILGGALALAIGALAAVRRRAADAPPDREPHAAISEVIESVIAEAEDSDDPRAVVIRSYARIEHAFAAAGLGRRPSEAPNEYLARVLSRLDVRPGAVTRLADLFAEARFSEHVVDAAAGAAAVAAMRAVHDDLAGAPR